MPHRLRHHHDIFHAPEVGCNTRLHLWRGLDGLANLHEVVNHEVEADREASVDVRSPLGDR